MKLLGVSPAGPLVQALAEKIIWFLPFPVFYIGFALFEMAIGLIALARGWERLLVYLLAGHLFVTILPLFILPEITWQGFLMPTLEGQYVIKNILIAAVAIVIGARRAD